MTMTRMSPSNVSTTIPAGAMMPYGAATAPDGWLLCNGAAVSRTTYATLFSVLSTTFGAGDGSTTFNVPDLRGRFPIGLAAAGTGSTLGGTGGNIDHTHSVDVAATTSGAPSATTAVLAGAVNVASDTHTHSTDPASVTSGTGNPPFQAVTYIIKT